MPLGFLLLEKISDNRVRTRTAGGRSLGLLLGGLSSAPPGSRALDLAGLASGRPLLHLGAPGLEQAGHTCTTSTEAGPAAPQQVPAQEPSDQVPTERPAIDETTSDLDDQPQAIHDEVQDNIRTDGEGQVIDVLKRKLSQEAGIVVGVNVCEKQCHRVLARFGGDLDKTVAALVRVHERKQQRHPAASDNKNNNDQQQQKKKRLDSAQLEALHEQRQACRAERLAARLARQEQKQHQDSNNTGTAKKRFDAASVESLVALMADLGLSVAKGRCTGALRRADGDVDAAKAELVDWCTKRQERQHNDNQTARAPIEGQETAEDGTDKKRMLAQLDQMGFGVPNGSIDKEAERIRRRNERLLKRFNGDVEQGDEETELASGGEERESAGELVGRGHGHSVGLVVDVVDAHGGLVDLIEHGADLLNGARIR